MASVFIFGAWCIVVGLMIGYDLGSRRIRKVGPAQLVPGRDYLLGDKLVQITLIEYRGSDVEMTYAPVEGPVH